MSVQKEGWIVKCGGSIKTWKKRWLVLRGNKLYYYKKKDDQHEQGSIPLTPGMKVREDRTCKKSPFAFCVETPDRAYVMFPANKSSQECTAWERAISSVLNPSSGSAANNDGASSGSVGAGAISPYRETAPQVSSAASSSRLDESIVGRLMFSKRISPFLQAEETQMCEFWNLWYNTVSQQLSEDPNCDIQFDFSFSEDFNKLYWNSAGPQYLMIQQLVDFFYIVGAPEEEIEKLNVVGENINPDRIGSWINVSEKGGIDGGWCFTFPIGLDIAIDSVETGPVCEQIKTWGKKNDISECFYLARDMGAEPPRQTEIRCHVGSSQGWGVVRQLYDLAGFPYPSQAAIDAIESANSIYVAVNVTEEEFVRVAVGIESPDQDVVRRFGNNRISEVEKGLGTVSSVEFQYLKTDFGYSVYREGPDVQIGFTVV